ncbi:unnamed protein product [Caenorhabditis angaria]|uniref:Serpentine receptor class gamma n=1 Tax=Caenorhabditis angaria TaxID=860376 RepID=A0A9P1IQM4_9PELO|nr:unnamed protein product [Caenorhabditis angaria]
MLFLIVIFGKNKRFSNSFYRIVQCDLVLNLCVYTNSWVHRLAQRPSTGYLLQNIPRQILVITSYTMPFFSHLQTVSITLLCFYRYSLLLEFMNFNKFWAKWYLLVYLGLITYTIAMILPISFTFFPLVYNSTDGCFVIHPDYYGTNHYVFGATVWIVSNVHLIIITTLGVLTVSKLRKRFSQHQNDTIRTRDMMKRVTLIVAINSAIYIIIIFWLLVVGVIFPDMNQVTQFEILVTVSDMISFSMPYTLLFFDKNIQEMMSEKIPSFSRNPSSIAVAPMT